MCSRRAFVATLPKRSITSTVGRDLRAPDLGLGHLDAHELVGIDARAELLERHAGGEVRGCGREDVARMERARDLRQPVARVGELVRRRDAELVGREHQQAVVGADEEPAVDRAHARSRGARSPTPGSTTARCTPTGRYGARVRAARARPAAPPAAGSRASRRSRAPPGAIRAITPWHVPTKSSCRPKSVRKVTTVIAASPSHRARQRRGQRGRASPPRPRRSRPTERATPRRLRADRDRRRVSADAGVRAGRRAGGEHDDVALGRLGREQPRAVERDEVGAERVDRAAARALGRREEHAARRPRELREQAVLRRLAGTNAGSIPCARSASAVPGPTAATAGRLRPRRAISSAPFGLVTITQS